MQVTGKYLKVWKVENKGTLKLVQLGDSYKNNGDYKNFSWFNVAFVGNAAKKQLSEKDMIEITSGQIRQEEYNGKWYTKITVFDFEIMNQRNQQQSKNSNSGLNEDYDSFQAIDGDDDIPF